jgi:precorrin-6A/cobalt-precorrin-6A reductase
MWWLWIAVETLLAMPHKVLILGGTAEARDIAASLLSAGHDVTSSLAGVTSKPLLPVGNIRVGGFGGADGLRDYLTAEKIDVLVDATHPFAAIISGNAHAAVQNSSTQLFRFERPAWQAVVGDRWMSVRSLKEAAQNLPANAHVFITTGRKDLVPFLAREDISGVIRTVEPPAEVMPLTWRVILDRPPHDFATECALFKREQFTHIISKNAGGDSTRAKLDAARELGLPVIMIERPTKPPCETFATVHSLTKRLGT